MLGVLACWIVLGCSTTLVLDVSRLGPGWIVLGCSTTVVLEMPRLDLPGPAGYVDLADLGQVTAKSIYLTSHKSI